MASVTMSIYTELLTLLEQKEKPPTKIRRPSTKKTVKPETPKESSQSDSEIEDEESPAATISTSPSASNNAKVETPSPELSSSESVASTAPTTSDEGGSNDSATSSGDEVEFESCTTDPSPEDAEVTPEAATKWVQVNVLATPATAAADDTPTLPTVAAAP